MIYVVSKNENIPKSFKVISPEESLEKLKNIKVISLDTETSGLDVHLDKLLTLQIGNKDIQVVVDITTTDIIIYKEFLLSRDLIIAHNYKFDGKWLYKYNIFPERIWDTFVIEKLLNLGLDYIRCGLQDVAKRYLDVYLDKSVRGDININTIASEEVILYAAKDVVHLEDIMLKQKALLEERKQEFAAKIENEFVPALAYIEYCGIKLDVDKWKYKMSIDDENFNKSEEALNDFVIDYVENTTGIPEDIWISNKKKTDYPQGIYAVKPVLDLFEEGPYCILNWNSSKQLVPLFKELGFNTKTKDKKTGLEKDSVDVRSIILQKDISPIATLFKNYSAANKRKTSFGENWLNAVNPNTLRIYPEFKQLVKSGRMSCGKGNNDNEDVDNDTSINLQQLSNDHLTRECFISEEGYSIIAADYGDQEGHMFADCANDLAWIEFYNDPNERDGHCFTAKMIFKDELKDIDEKDVKKVRPDLRQKAKAPRFTKVNPLLEIILTK